MIAGGGPVFGGGDEPGSTSSSVASARLVVLDRDPLEFAEVVARSGGSVAARVGSDAVAGVGVVGWVAL